MSTPEETAKNIVRQYIEGYNDHDPVKVSETIADDIVVTGLPERDGPVRGAEAYLEWASEMLETFPDLRAETEEMIVEGNTVAVGWEMHGTHEGPLGDVPATGESVTFDSQAIFHVEDDEIVEKRFVMDELGMLEQLGVV